MSGNGHPVMMMSQMRKTQQHAGCCVAVAGATTQASAPRGVAAAAHLSSRSAIWVFVWRELYYLTAEPLYPPCDSLLLFLCLLLESL